jgi:hypothetical protein
MLRKLLHTLKVKVLHMVYFAHLYSHISYGLVFWGSASSKRIFFIIKKRTIMIMLRLDPRSSYGEGLKKFDILTFPCLYSFIHLLCVLLIHTWSIDL